MIHSFVVCVWRLHLAGAVFQRRSAHEERLSQKVPISARVGRGLVSRLKVAMPPADVKPAAMRSWRALTSSGVST